jgi:capsular polysaccharide biosynthesis protein
VELRTYWAIIWRRLWIIVLIVGIVALYAGYQYYHLRKTPGALKAYQSTITMRIGLEATSQSTDQSYADYVSISESLADELATGPVLTTNEFDTQIVQQIQSDIGSGEIANRFGSNPDLGDWQNASAVGSSLTATALHNLVTINVMWSTPAGAWAIANAVGEVSQAHISTYLDYEVRNNPSSSPQATNTHPLAAAGIVSGATDPAQVPGVSASKPLLLVVLVFVALIIAIALAFLIEYLDDRIRSGAEVARLLQLPVYGEVPRAPSVVRVKSERSPAA